MSLLCELEGLTGYSATWKRQATPAGRSWWVLMISVQATEGSGSGLWATAKATYSGRSQEAHELAKQKAREKYLAGEYARGSGPPSMQDLNRQAALWPTPTVQDGENIAGKSQEVRNSLPLNTEARLWPTPRCAEGMNRAVRTSETLIATGAKGRLEDSVSPAMWPTATVCGNYNRQGASKDSGDGLATASRSFLPPETTSQVGLLLQKWTTPSCPVLNVKFVEWLQGYPEGWTELPEDSEITG
jgi:hypothetical protein